MGTAIVTNDSHLVRKFGVAGLAFFFVKGILWLLAPFVFALFI